VLPRQSARVSIVNDVNFMLYTPLLPGAAAGTLEPRHVVIPLRDQLRHTDLRLGTVLDADLDAGHVRVKTLEGHDEELHYDQLIVTLGAVSRALPIPGLAEHALGFKTLPDAIALRNRLLQRLEAAETLEDPAARQGWLTFIFVGAATPGSRASPSCRTSRPTSSTSTRAAGPRGCAGSWSRRATA
jgi:NADH dehydrogenase